MRLTITLILAMLCALAPVPDAGSPWLAGAAHADDDGDDGGDDDGGDDDGDDDGPGPGPGAGGPDRGGERAAPRTPGRNAPARDQRPATAAARPAFAANEIVALGVTDAQRAELQRRGYVVLEERPLGLTPGRASLRLSVPRGLTLEAARDDVRAVAPGANADFNHFYRSDETPEAAPPCQGPACDARSQIRWPLPLGSPAVECRADAPIGMVDTGVNAAHPALAGRVDAIRLDPSVGAAADAVHGTAVAALLAGAPDSSTPGLLPDAPLIAVDTFHKVGGDQRSDAFSLIAGLDLLAGRGVRVINLSLSGPANAALEQVIRLLHDRGTVLVAAVGNGGAAAGLAWPAAYPEVIAVTAVDSRDAPYRRAQQGPHVELAAPGVQVWTAASVAGGRRRNGTSFAAPFVSAAGSCREVGGNLKAA